MAPRLPAARGAKSAQELVEQLKDEYLIMGGLMVVKKGGGISISFDACGTFRHWSAVHLPLELIDQIDEDVSKVLISHQMARPNS